MSQLSAKVDIDREKGGVSMNVYGGYLKALRSPGGVYRTSHLCLGAGEGDGFPQQLTARLLVFLLVTL